MRATPHSPAQTGFTLLELLLALTLGALIMAGVGRFLSQSFALGRTQEETASFLAASGNLIAKLGTALRSAQLKEGRDDLFFLATDEASTVLLFTTKVGRELKLVGWATLDDELYYLEETPELILQAGELPTAELLVGRGAQKLTGSLTGFSLQFFDGQDWSPTWDSRTQNTLPLEVEISFTTVDGGKNQVHKVSLPQGGGGG